MSHHVLVAYYSHAGHTARIARTIMETIVAEGHGCDMVDMMEGVREGVDWAKYDIVIVGSPIVYGVYNKIVWEFCSMYKNEIESRPNSFFNVTVVARSPEKATPEGNRYLQKFVKRSAWKPRDLKCFAGKVDYPNWNFFERMMIRIIMKIRASQSTTPTTTMSEPTRATACSLTNCRLAVRPDADRLTLRFDCNSRSAANRLTQKNLGVAVAASCRDAT